MTVFIKFNNKTTFDIFIYVTSIPFCSYLISNLLHLYIRYFLRIIKNLQFTVRREDCFLFPIYRKQEVKVTLVSRSELMSSSLCTSGLVFSLCTLPSFLGYILTLSCSHRSTYSRKSFTFSFGISLSFSPFSISPVSFFFYSAFTGSLSSINCKIKAIRYSNVLKRYVNAVAQCPHIFLN